MKISKESITTLQKVITGDELREKSESIAPYKSGQELIGFFNEFGEKDEYGNDFPSRWVYTENKIEKFNGTSTLKEIMESAVDPRRFIASDYQAEEAVDFLNDYLQYDSYQLVKSKKGYKLIEKGSTEIHVKKTFDSGRIDEELVMEQLEKCDTKIARGDYTGAITNSRSLVEAILRDIERQLYASPQDYDGDLSNLYKRVYNKMNLDPSKEGLKNSIREVLGGLISVVSGLAPLRNQSSDAHVPEFEPNSHHAKLAVNVAKTISAFFISSLKYQIKNGFLEIE